MINAQHLQAVGVGEPQAHLIAEPLRLACKRYDLLTGPRIAAFVAQTAHVSRMYTHLEDRLTYRTAEDIKAAFPRTCTSLAIAGRFVGNGERLASFVYAGELGNGDIASGDGWRYRPRGCFRLVGRAEYMAAGEAVGLPLKDRPDLVADPQWAILTSAWYWAAAGLHLLIDRGEYDATCRRLRIVGDGFHAEHKQLIRRCLDVFA